MSLAQLRAITYDPEDIRLTPFELALADFWSEFSTYVRMESVLHFRQLNSWALEYDNLNSAVVAERLDELMARCSELMETLKVRAIGTHWGGEPLWQRTSGEPLKRVQVSMDKVKSLRHQVNPLARTLKKHFMVLYSGGRQGGNPIITRVKSMSNLRVFAELAGARDELLSEPTEKKLRRYEEKAELARESQIYRMALELEGVEEEQLDNRLAGALASVQACLILEEVSL